MPLYSVQNTILELLEGLDKLETENIITGVNIKQEHGDWFLFMQEYIFYPVIDFPLTHYLTLIFFPCFFHTVSPTICFPRCSPFFPFLIFSLFFHLVLSFYPFLPLFTFYFFFVLLLPSFYSLTARLNFFPVSFGWISLSSQGSASWVYVNIIPGTTAPLGRWAVKSSGNKIVLLFFSLKKLYTFQYVKNAQLYFYRMHLRCLF